jgi:hypothetical protein
MPFGCVNPNSDWKRLTRRNLARSIFVKTQYTPIRLNIEMPIVDSPILEPLPTVLTPYQSLVHPETLRMQ